MTGARLSVTVDDKRLLGGLARLRAIGHDQAVLHAIGSGLVSNVEDRLGGTTDPDGHPWAPLNPAYAALKKGGGMLRESSQLAKSITFRVSGSSIEVGSLSRYAGVHQFGATIGPKTAKALVFKLAGGLVRAKKVVIPARPYLGFGAEDRAIVLDVLDRAVRRAFRG
jgi:phage virion morphogenesis protein